MATSLLPLEEYVRKLLSKSRDDMPDRNTDYWAKYLHLLDALRAYVYPHVNAGLACLSKSPGIYTDHGPDHFDEVVRYAGLLLGVPSGGAIKELRPYELYLMLCAIRLHDAGNVEGREGHERRASRILQQYGGTIALDSAEAKLVGDIAEAHGGTTLTGSKDTIGELPDDDTPIGSISCRPRQVAALVRFADEICEHSTRAARHHMLSGTLPDANKLFHYYAASVKAAHCGPPKCFKLRLEIDTQYLLQPYPLPSTDPGVQVDKYLIDDVLDRISKLDRERRYCNQFLAPSLRTEELEIHIEFQEDTQVRPDLRKPLIVDDLHIRIPPKEGYPAAHDSWRDERPELRGATLAERAKEGWR